jgi:ATP phosphoribosyltransferase
VTVFDYAVLLIVGLSVLLSVMRGFVREVLALAAWLIAFVTASLLSGVVAGRRRRYVMMNAHVDDLPAIRAVLPGMGAPSVLQLADDGEIAVHAAVEVDEIWNLLPVLRRAGATSILVLPIERLVA